MYISIIESLTFFYNNVIYLDTLLVGLLYLHVSLTCRQIMIKLSVRTDFIIQHHLVHICMNHRVGLPILFSLVHVHTIPSKLFQTYWCTCILCCSNSLSPESSEWRCLCVLSWLACQWWHTPFSISSHFLFCMAFFSTWVWPPSTVSNSLSASSFSSSLASVGQTASTLGGYQTTASTSSLLSSWHSS